MKRCPKCHRFGIEHANESALKERCIWKDCLWVNEDNIDVTKVVHPITNWKFIKAIKERVLC